jgi:hypothetical protein
MANTILIKRSGTANAVPLSVNLALGELAINYTDGKLFYKNGSGVVVSFASGATISNDVATSTNVYPSSVLIILVFIISICLLGVKVIVLNKIIS